MIESAKILIVDDDEDILTAARLLLRRSFGDVITCRRPEEVPDLLERYDFDAVLLDMNFGPAIPRAGRVSNGSAASCRSIQLWSW